MYIICICSLVRNNLQYKIIKSKLNKNSISYLRIHQLFRKPPPPLDMNGFVPMEKKSINTGG